MHEQEITSQTIEMSNPINELAAALAKAQGDMSAASKDNINPHFKSKYADLSSVWDACREALSKNELSIVQIPESNGAEVSVTTILLHSSGQFIQGKLTMMSQKNTPQAQGSCVTYARRYALSSFVGIAPDDDDDANAASTGGNQRPAPKQEISQPQMQRLYTLQGQSKWSTVELKDILAKKYGIQSSRELTKVQYDEVCKALLDNPKAKEEAKTEATDEAQPIGETQTEQS